MNIEQSTLDAYQLLQQLCPAEDTRQILIIHGECIANLASQIATHANIPLPRDIILEAALLHDIGVVGVNAAEIHCHGKQPYLQHGIIGAEMLRKIAKNLQKSIKVDITSKNPESNQPADRDTNITPNNTNISPAERLERYALVCERHIGTGLTKAEIVSRKLPLPAKDFLPQSDLEKLICIADKFYSKSPGKRTTRKSCDLVRQQNARHGQANLARLEDLFAYFDIPNLLGET